jgi:hypothetical protein
VVQTHGGPGPARWRKATAVLVACACVSWPAFAGPPPGPRFASEVVRLEVAGAEQTVEGSYVFVNDAGPTRAAILYPFPADSLLGVPRLLGATISHGSGPPEPLAIRATDRAGWRWTLALAARETCRVTIRYAQPLAAHHAAYVLTSTKAWGRPLEHARLEVVLPADAARPRFSLPFRRAAGGGVWTCEKRRFLPARDLIVEWTKFAGPRRP